MEGKKTFLGFDAYIRLWPYNIGGVRPQIMNHSNCDTFRTFSTLRGTTRNEKIMTQNYLACDEASM
jgi:hypothetical protein